MLNFDPRRWIAERECDASVATVATVAGQTAKTENSLRPTYDEKPRVSAGPIGVVQKSNSTRTPATLATSATPLISAPDSKRAPAAILREWHAKLEPLAERAAPEGIDPGWWNQAVLDSWWLYENFCSRLVRAGWSELDVFGVVPGETHLGGIVARLGGSRNLKIEGVQAVWSLYGIRDWTCAGGTDCLIPKGIRPLWDLGR